MREKYLIISERTFAYCLAGQLYAQAPNHQPRKTEVIMKKAIELFRNYELHSIVFGDAHQIAVIEKDLYAFCDKLLKSIPEFTELNLTQIEYDNGLRDPEDPNRPKYAFTSRYDIKDENSWKGDFVDLYAFVNNFCRSLNKESTTEKDCFLCIHQPEDSESTLAPGDSDTCKNCSINPKLTMNYECERFAKGNYTIVCNYDCYNSKYICCSECKNKDTCKHKCDSTPDKCNNHK